MRGNSCAFRLSCGHTAFPFYNQPSPSLCFGRTIFAMSSFPPSVRPRTFPPALLDATTTRSNDSTAAIPITSRALWVINRRHQTTSSRFLSRVSPVGGSHFSTLGYRSACVSRGPNLVSRLDLFCASVELFLFLCHYSVPPVVWIFGTTFVHDLS